MNDQSTLGSWFTLFRFGNSLTGLIGVFFGSLLALGDLPQGNFASITILHGLSVWAFMCSWNALNDILDVEIDRENKPNRPLPSGAISISRAKIVTSSLMLISFLSLILAGYISTSFENGLEDWAPSILIWLLAIFLLVNYESSSNFSLKLKDRGLPGNIAISLSVGMVILFGAAGVFDFTNARVISLFAIGFTYNLAREIIKDIEDIDGDLGRNTLAMRVGVEKARMVAWVILLFTMVSLLAPFAFDIFPKEHLILIIPGVMALLLVKRKLAYSEDRNAQLLIKKSLQLSLLGLIISALI
ncbi:MAG: geranylgeranylglycerol-phosphate geranylgeranyltransferase [Candidatus Poseidoniales archaeon]|jgi:geranylgeranylglycerol-phosphate geranylgeranyltransferase|nr:geranylgeranylglycerol-phosphate geranylgeranyltransferase [Candidatus Poseidoniales archaeon]|tara:strand:+ start:1597 stop:2499 length:903 start_codon:yes stop_codon:yes gene_type:complete